MFISAVLTLSAGAVLALCGGSAFRVAALSLAMGAATLALGTWSGWGIAPSLLCGAALAAALQVGFFLGMLGLAGQHAGGSGAGLRRRPPPA